MSLRSRFSLGVARILQNPVADVIGHFQCTIIPQLRRKCVSLLRVLTKFHCSPSDVHSMHCTCQGIKDQVMPSANKTILQIYIATLPAQI